MVGLSCSRKPGSFWKVAARSTLRAAEASEARRAATTQRPTSARLLESAVITVSALVVRSRITWFSCARIASVLSVSRSAGLAR